MPVTQNPQWKVGTTANSITNRNDGNVGIGTAAPASLLEVAGTITVTPASGTSGILIQGTCDSASSYALYLTTTMTGTTTNKGLLFQPTQTSISSSQFYGIDARPFFNATSGGPQGTIYGLLGIPTIKATATADVTSIYGGYFRVDNFSTAGSVLTNAYVVGIADPTNTGTITNAYGLLISNITSGGTLNFAIKTGTGLVQFGDNVGIGVKPVVSLQVLGGVSVGGDDGGIASYVSFTNAVTAVSTGVGTVLMGGTTARNSTGWIKIYNGTAARYIPFWTTITG